MHKFALAIHLLTVYIAYCVKKTHNHSGSVVMRRKTFFSNKEEKLTWLKKR